MNKPLPKKWSEYLRGLPESGMGYQLVDVSFTDGSRLKNVSVLNSTYIDLPATHFSKRIRDISIHKKDV